MIRKSVLSYLHLQNTTSTANNAFKYASKPNFKLLYSCKYCSSFKEGLKGHPGNNINEQHATEKEFLVRLKNDPDSFGYQNKKEEYDSDDAKEEEYLQNKPLVSQKLSTKQYADIIKQLVKNRKIQEAIDVLEVRMLKEDRVRPENYIYSLLIGACGRVGYTKKAFSLFNNLKKRGLKPHPGMYTALFNACANSPWPQTDGLSRARHLRNLITEKLYQPNEPNYNAMIKAFGRCGDLAAAFEIVDEMAQKKFPIKADTLNFLLQACITDKEAGFRHALLVWCKFAEKKVEPDLFTFNLMLRCIRDCNLGDLEVTKDIIGRLVSDIEDIKHKKVQYLESGPQNSEIVSVPINSDNVDVDSNSNLFEDVRIKEDRLSYSSEIKENRPNLMAKVPHLGNIISLSEVKTPQDRLLLVGGLLGFIATMVRHNCTPDIKTFTQLLDNIPGTLSAEKELLQHLRKYNVKPDVDFFNMLIRKRSMRFEYQSAQEVLSMIRSEKLRPNLITYGVLALGCKTKEEALSLIEEMKAAKYRLNIEILGAMLHQACYHNNFYYVMELMEICTREDIKPHKKFMSSLEEFKKKSKKISNDKSDPLSMSEAYKKGYTKFKMRYKVWLQEISVYDVEDEHPWQQYRQAVETNVKHYKDKQEASRFKPKHKSLFRQKTSAKALAKN